MTSPVDANVYTDLTGLASLKREARASDPHALREVARQFESVFAKMMLKSMRAASFGDSIFDSEQTKFYQGMFDDQLAMELTKGKGLGLADVLVQQLQRQGVAPKDGAEGAKTSGVDKSGSVLGPAKSTALESGASPTATGRTLTPDEFVKELWPCAESAGKELGVDPTHLLAQAALETGWGKSLPCDANGNTSFNFFGIKAGESWNGDSVSVRTLEVENGVATPRQARFRAYTSAADSFRDYVSVLKDNPRYADALNTGSDAKAFATALQRGGYATDPAYAQKITAIAQNLASASGLKSADDWPIPSSHGPL